MKVEMVMDDGQKRSRFKKTVQWKGVKESQPGQSTLRENPSTPIEDRMDISDRPNQVLTEYRIFCRIVVLTEAEAEAEAE